MSRHELTDAQWAVIQPLLPKQQPGPGRKRADDRPILNGILFVLKTGCTWEDVPRVYGAPTTCWRRFQVWMMDAGLPGRQFRPGEKRGTGVGKPKVGKGSKVMVVTDGHGLPIGLHADSARPHESQLAETTLAAVRVPRQQGRPRVRPKELVADRAYDSREFRRYLRRQGIKPTIPTYTRRPRQRPKRGRPIHLGPNYRHRWKVERCFGWMDNYRRLVVRYERYADHYKAFCFIAIILWCVNLSLK